MLESIIAFAWPLVVLILGIIVIVKFSNVQFDWKEKKFVFNKSQTATKDPEKIKKLNHMDALLEKVNEDIRGMLYKHMVYDMGVPKDYLQNNIDFVLLDSLTENTLYSNRYPNALKTELKKIIDSNDYKYPDTYTVGQKEDHINRFIESKQAVLVSSLMTIFNAKYDNVYSEFDRITKESTFKVHTITVEQVSELIKPYIKEVLIPQLKELLYPEFYT